MWGTFPTSLGSTSTPTERGIKVIMEKGADISHARARATTTRTSKWTQRLTYDGEYLHAAPWNTYNIDHGINSSNGCTNLHDADAEKLYNFLRDRRRGRVPERHRPADDARRGLRRLEPVVAAVADRRAVRHALTCIRPDTRHRSRAGRVFACPGPTRLLRG